MDRKTKEIIFGQDVRDEADKGLEIAYRAVSTTLGVKGRNVMYELPWGPPNVIHDGVTVAKELVLKNPFQNMVAQMVIQAAGKTNDEAGDGTTTATVLVYAIAHEGLKIVSSGTNPAIIRKGIEKAVAAAVAELQAIAKPVKTRIEMEQVATISAGDPELGKLIAEAIEKVGEKGLTSVQEGQGSEIVVEYKEGMEFDKGWLSPYLVTNGEKLETEYQSRDQSGDNDVYVVIVNDKLNNDKLVAVLEKVYSYDRTAQILLIADDYDVDAQASIVLTKLRGHKPLVAVKAPEFGDHRTNLLTDIATVTGGMVIGGTNGIQMEAATLESIGRCERVLVTQTATQIIGGKGKKESIEERVTALQTQMKELKMDPFRKDKIESRLAKLVGGVAVINVGAPSEAEMREKKERIYDAVNATKAAISEGIIPGGGVALLRARRAIKKLKLGKEKIGADIVHAALSYPINKLIENAGVEKPDFIVGKIEENPDENYGYNVDTEEYVNLIEAGIIDPLKVARSALTNAASTATMIITTECMMITEREEHKTSKTNEEGIGDWVD